jgi:hypothetical protein
MDGALLGFAEPQPNLPFSLTEQYWVGLNVRVASRREVKPNIHKDVYR